MSDKQYSGNGDGEHFGYFHPDNPADSQLSQFAPHLQPTEDPGYFYVRNELRVKGRQALAALVAKKGFKTTEAPKVRKFATVRVTPKGFDSYGVDCIPELVEALWSEGVEAQPHYAVLIAGHSQFGPWDAPLRVERDDPEHKKVTQRLSRANGSGRVAVVIDTGLLPSGVRTAIPKTAIGISDTDPAAGVVAGGAMNPYVGHGTFVTGVILQAAPRAKVHVFRPKGLSVQPQGMLLSDANLARSLARALASVAAGRPASASKSNYVRKARVASDQLKEMSKAQRPAVLNLSLAGPAHQADLDPLPATRKILEFWHGLGVCIVAAAGNNHSSAKHYPAAYDIVCGVGASTPSDPTGMKNFSNFGPWVSTYENGENVLSAFAEGGSGRTTVKVAQPNSPRQQTDGPWTGVARWSGTSFAAPLVSGRVLKGNPCC